MHDDIAFAAHCGCRCILSSSSHLTRPPPRRAPTDIVELLNGRHCTASDGGHDNVEGQGPTGKRKGRSCLGQPRWKGISEAGEHWTDPAPPGLANRRLQPRFLDRPLVLVLLGEFGEALHYLGLILHSMRRREAQPAAAGARGEEGGARAVVLSDAAHTILDGRSTGGSARGYCPRR